MKQMRVTGYLPQAKVIVECSHSGAEQLEKLIEHIKEIGNTGHTFDIVVDPTDEGTETFEWDGDGADSIGKITTENLEELRNS